MAKSHHGSSSVTAPYRFVPIEREYVQKPPVSLDDIRFDTPLQGGSISAVLNVEWTAKTPVCIGEKNQTGVVMPLQVGNRYCLSGTSLRGMLRSVLEIATFSHLGKINGHHHHGVRHFAGFGEFAKYHAVVPAALKAGWLRYEPETEQWKLYPAVAEHKNKKTYPGESNKFVLAKITAILDKTAPDKRPTLDKWLDGMSIAQKYAALERSNVSTVVKDVFPLEGAENPRKTEVLRVGLKPKDVQAKVSDYHDYPCKNLNFVFTGPYRQASENGKMPFVDEDKIKQNESLFPNAGKQGYIIPQDWMKIFHLMNAEETSKGGNPRKGSPWRTWLQAKGWHEVFGGFAKIDGDEVIPDNMKKIPYGIPVFWKGDISDLANIPDLNNPPSPGRQTFWFSLSRVMRIPHAWSVGQVAQRLYSRSPGDAYKVPRMRENNGWDFGRALFGSIDLEENSTQDKQKNKQLDGTQTEEALKGRVSVGFAYAPDNTRAETQSKIGVFSQPKESFWPFYLRDADGVPGMAPQDDLTTSYSSDNAVPAGRKRTMVRARAVQFPSGTPATESTIRFLPENTRFQGQIRVHNLSLIEFGALLFALTFGVTDGSRLHQIGRAKGMGHGALSPRVTFAKVPQLSGLDMKMTADQANSQIGAWIDEFKTWMTKAMTAHNLREFDRHPAIRLLLASADPQAGARLAGNLQTGELPNFKTWRENLHIGQDGSRSAEYPLKTE